MLQVQGTCTTCDCQEGMLLSYRYRLWWGHQVRLTCTQSTKRFSSLANFMSPLMLKIFLFISHTPSEESYYLCWCDCEYDKMFVISTITTERKWINTFHTNMILRLIVEMNYSWGDWGHCKISGKMYSVVLGMKNAWSVHNTLYVHDVLFNIIFIV